MIILVALGLAVVDVITLTSLHSYLYGRVDAQLNGASRVMATFVSQADLRGFPVTRSSIQSRVSPDIYVELIRPGRGPDGGPAVGDGRPARPAAPAALPAPRTGGP